MLEVVGDFLPLLLPPLFLKSVTCLLELTQLNREGIGQLKKTKTKQIKKKEVTRMVEIYIILFGERVFQKKFQCVFYQTMRKHNT